MAWFLVTHIFSTKLEFIGIGLLFPSSSNSIAGATISVKQETIGQVVLADKTQKTPINRGLLLEVKIL